jgi:hypothetical protein
MQMAKIQRIQHNSDNIVKPLNSCDAFCKGRINASKLKVKNKMFRYIDVCSLYPSVQYSDYYPVGHPEKTYKPYQYNNGWYGLIKCKILPTKTLYHPVLSIKKYKSIFN